LCAKQGGIQTGWINHEFHSVVRLQQLFKEGNRLLPPYEQDTLYVINQVIAQVVWEYDIHKLSKGNIKSVEQFSDGMLGSSFLIEISIPTSETHKISSKSILVQIVDDSRNPLSINTNYHTQEHNNEVVNIIITTYNRQARSSATHSSK